MMSHEAMQHESMNKLWTGDNGGILRCWDVDPARAACAASLGKRVLKDISNLSISKLHNATVYKNNMTQLCVSFRYFVHLPATLLNRILHIGRADVVQFTPGKRCGKGSGLRLQQCAAWNRGHVESEYGKYHL